MRRINDLRFTVQFAAGVVFLATGSYLDGSPKDAVFTLRFAGCFLVLMASLDGLLNIYDKLAELAVAIWDAADRAGRRIWYTLKRKVLT